MSIFLGLGLANNDFSGETQRGTTPRPAPDATSKACTMDIPVVSAVGQPGRRDLVANITSAGRWVAYRNRNADNMGAITSTTTIGQTSNRRHRHHTAMLIRSLTKTKTL
jgi:hypothetical protein